MILKNLQEIPKKGQSKRLVHQNLTVIPQKINFRPYPFGLDERVYALESEVASLRRYEIGNNMDKVVLGALVELENIDSEEKRHRYVLPAGAGTKIETDRGPVNIITTSAPLFAAMMGKEEGDEFIFKIKNSKQEYCITEVK